MGQTSAPLEIPTWQAQEGWTMLRTLHSSLPIEYQLKYGTACGNLDFTHLVGDSASDRVGGVYGGFSQEEFFGILWTNPSPFAVNGLDALLVSLDRR